MLNDIKKAILSGIMISIGGAVYLSCIAKNLTWLGAFLFSTGLFTICVYGFNLYTGKVGYLAVRYKEGRYWLLVFVTLIFNLLTTYLLGVLVGKTINSIVPVTKNIYSAKLSAPLWKSFVSAIFCGMLMYLAVDTWKQGHKMGVFLCVPTFILCGFDHSIANSFYNGVANGFNAFTLNNLLFVLVVVAGNAVGGVIVPLLTTDYKKLSGSPKKTE